MKISYGFGHIATRTTPRPAVQIFALICIIGVSKCRTVTFTLSAARRLLLTVWPSPQGTFKTAISYDYETAHSHR